LSAPLLEGFAEGTAATTLAASGAGGGVIGAELVALGTEGGVAVSVSAVVMAGSCATRPCESPREIPTTATPTPTIATTANAGHA
jgi:hypothetical protein